MRRVPHDHPDAALAQPVDLSPPEPPSFDAREHALRAALAPLLADILREAFAELADDAAIAHAVGAALSRRDGEALAPWAVELDARAHVPLLHAIARCLAARDP